MKKKIATAIMALLALQAQAEVVTGYKADHDVQNLPKDAPIWFNCFSCGDALKNEVVRRLRENGFTLVDKRDDATFRVIFAVMASVPQGDKAPGLYGEEVYGKGLPAIPPAITGDLAEVKTPGSPKGILNIDAGHVNEGMQITGSQAGGIAVGLIGAFLGRLVQQQIADRNRTPGVVELNVSIIDKEWKVGQDWKGFKVMAAANTAETPDKLIDAAVDSAIAGLINGVAGEKVQ